MSSKLRLKTIAHSNGTDAITVNSSGYVLTPKRPAFNVNGINGGDATLSSNSSPSTRFYITHNTANLNQGSCWSSSTGKFTAPVAGIYFFHATVTFRNKNERWVSAGFFKEDGSSWTSNAYHGMSLMDDVEGVTQYASVQPNMTVELAVNDTVRVGAFSDDGNAGLWSAGNHFGGYLVG